MKQRKARTALTVVAIAVSSMMYLTLSASTGYMDQMYQDSTTGFTGQMFVKSLSSSTGAVGEFPPLSSSLTMGQADQLMNVSGIDGSRSAPLLLVALAPAMFTNGPPSAIAVGVEEGKEVAFYGDTTFQSGTGVITEKDQVVLGANAASSIYNANVGDSVLIQGRNLTVVGVGDKTGSIITDGMVLMPLSTAQELFNRPGVTTVLLAAVTPQQVDEVATEVQLQFPGLGVMTQDEMAEVLESSSSLIHTFVGLVEVTMLIVAGVVTLTMMLISVGERTKEFGMMRAIGASRYTVLSLVLGETLITCLVGSLIGVPLSLVMITLMFSSQLVSLISLVTTIEAIVFITAIGVLAGLIPAYRSARIQPMEAIHYE